LIGHRQLWAIADSAGGQLTWLAFGIANLHGLGWKKLPALLVLVQGGRFFGRPMPRRVHRAG